MTGLPDPGPAWVDDLPDFDAPPVPCLVPDVHWDDAPPVVLLYDAGGKPLIEDAARPVGYAARPWRCS